MNLKTILKHQVQNYLLENPIDDAKPDKYKEVCRKFNLKLKTASKYWIELKQEYPHLALFKSLPKATHLDQLEKVNFTQEEVNKILKQEGDNLDIILNKVDFEIRSLEDLLAICEVDTSKWEVVSWQCKKWDLGIKNTDNKIETKELYSVSAKFKAIKVENNLFLQKELIKKELFDAAPRQDLLNSYQYFMDALTGFANANNKKFLLELSIPDLHIGKLAHREESGEDYDIKIATARYKNAIKELLSRVNLKHVSKILLPIGNDIIQVDNSGNTTTAGTRVDTDGRYFKIIRAVKELLIETVIELSSIAPVDVVVVPGNHDTESSFLIGEILDAYFSKATNVNVYNEASLRKYYQFGKVGMLFTHGDKEKHANLGMIFAAENPKLWADTSYRFIKLGHLHHNRKIDYLNTQEYQGFQIQVLPSLSGSDSWHKQKGFISLKQAKSFLYHPETGVVAEYTYTV
jgi:hypothetical protein